MNRLCCVLIGALVAVSASLGFGADEQEDAAFLDGLRERRLFDLGLAYCRRELAAPELSRKRQASLTIESIRTLTAEAFHSSLEQRRDRFAAAHQAANTFRDENAQHPRLVLVDVQNGLAYLAQANLIRQELEAGLTPIDGRETALAAIRDAIGVFDGVDEYLETEIPLRYRATPGPDDLTADQLLALRNRVKHQRAQSIQCRALLYDQADRLNRIDALSQVIGEYGELAATVPRENRLWWEASIDRARCLRLMGRVGEARAIIDQFPTPPPDADIEARGLAERVLIDLAEDKPAEGLQRALAWSQAGRPASAEIEFAALQCMVRLTAHATESADRQAQWQKQAVAQTERIESAFGPYWGRRSSRLLVATASGGNRTANFDVLMRVGDEAFRKGDLSEAVDAYQQAAELASENQQQVPWFEAGRKAGLTLQQLENHRGAADWLRDVATGAPKLADASRTHLQAAWNLSRLAQQDPQLLDEYAELLEETIGTWPETTEADQARLWLGRLQEYRQDFRTAFNVLLDCNPATDRMTEAVVQAQRCAESLCQQEQSSGNEVAGIATALAERFEQLLPASDEEPWHQSAALAAIGAARLHLLYGAKAEKRASELLERLRKIPELKLEEEWQHEAEGLLVIAIARQPERQQELPGLLRQIAGAAPTRLLTIATALEQLVQESSGSSRESLAQAALPIITQIQEESQSLTPRQTQQVERMFARMLAAAGELDQARVAFRELIRESPRDGVLIEEFAVLLTSSTQETDRGDALGLWRQLARGSQPQTDRWFRAKFQVALALDRQGKTQEANRLLRFLKETPPGWDRSSLKEDFERLLKKTEQ